MAYTSQVNSRYAVSNIPLFLVISALGSVLNTMKGLSDTLDEEIAPFGLRSICFDSGCFRTPVLGKVRYKPGAIEDYKEAGEVINATLLGASIGKPYENTVADI